MNNENTKKKVLILGGSTFMGKTLLDYLSSDPQYEVHYVNRGRKYWDNEIVKMKNIHFSYGNRDETSDYSKV